MKHYPFALWNAYENYLRQTPPQEPPLKKEHENVSAK